MWSRLLSVNQQSEGYILVLLSPIVLIPTMQNNQVHSWIIPLLLLVFFWRKKQNKQKNMQRTSGFYLCWNMGSELSGRTKDFKLLNHHCDPIRSHSSVRDKRCSDWLMCQTKNGQKASKQEPKEKTHSLILTIHFRQLLNFYSALWCLPFHCVSSILLYKSLSICVF